MAEIENNLVEFVHAAATCGVNEAQALYGQMLLDGKLVEASPTAALYWFERAALAGNVMAMNMVGRCLDQGWGVTRNTRLAERWFRKAAERGLDWGMYNLATVLVLGEGGIEPDRTEAFYWLNKAAELGHVKSLNLLGSFYEDGWEVQQNREVARAYYRRAALGGDFRGQFNYSRFLIQEGDLLGGLYWLRQVPLTATPAFLRKMKSFLRNSPVQLLQEFAASIAESQTENQG